MKRESMSLPAHDSSSVATKAHSALHVAIRAVFGVRVFGISYRSRTGCGIRPDIIPHLYSTPFSFEFQKFQKRSWSFSSLSSSNYFACPKAPGLKFHVHVRKAQHGPHSLITTRAMQQIRSKTRQKTASVRPKSGNFGPFQRENTGLIWQRTGVGCNGPLLGDRKGFIYYCKK